MEKIKNLLSQSTYFIQQVKEWAEIIVDFETANKYKIEDSGGQEIGGIFEQGSGFGKMIARQFLRNHRPLTISVMNKSSENVLTLDRPFYFFWSNLNVLSSEGQILGCAKRRFGFLFFKKYDLLDQHGTCFGTISSPLWRLWTFKVLCPRTEQLIATISKRWGGVLKEAFTDADRFGINYDSTRLTIEQKAVIFSTAIAIDFDFFEDNNRKN